VKQNRFPPGWDEDRVRQVLAHYEKQTEAEAGAEDEAALEDGSDLQRPAPRLLADAMLGALARWLRALGVDVTYDPDLDDPELVELAFAEGRTILTRDRRLTERRLARNHLLIRSDDVAEQLHQVLTELVPAVRELIARHGR
jgi:hypothetical protein